MIDNYSLLEYEMAVMGAYCDLATKVEIYPLTCDVNFLKNVNLSIEFKSLLDAVGH